MTNEEVAAIMAARTEGPWEVGDGWGAAGVLPTMFGEGRCAYCKSSEPVWIGRRDINGTKMLSHMHRTEDYSDGHRISGPMKDGQVAGVAGNYDYEAGGILRPEDARAIVTAVNEWDLLEAVRKAAADLVLPEGDPLIDALAALDAHREAQK